MRSYCEFFSEFPSTKTITLAQFISFWDSKGTSSKLSDQTNLVIMKRMFFLFTVEDLFVILRQKSSIFIETLLMGEWILLNRIHGEQVEIS